MLLVRRSPWWAAGAIPMLALGVWLTIAGIRAQRDFVADEAIESAAECDRAHSSEGLSDEDGERSRWQASETDQSVSVSARSVTVRCRVSVMIQVRSQAAQPNQGAHPS